MLRPPNDSQSFGAGGRQASQTSGSRDYFSSTRWSLVIDAGDSQSCRTDSALNELCSRYWFPLYAYARHSGNSRADAEDLVQSFFSHFVAKNHLQALNRDKGRFRAFLIACFKNHSRNEWKRVARQKRGGGADHIPFDWATADEKFRSQLISAETAERTYDRTWVVTLLEQVLAQLGREMHAKQHGELFDVLKPSLAIDGDGFNYRASANRLKKTEQAMRAAAMRLRRRYRELFRQKVLETCDPAHLEQELRSLLKAFSD